MNKNDIVSTLLHERGKGYFNPEEILNVGPHHDLHLFFNSNNATHNWVFTCVDVINGDSGKVLLVFLVEAPDCSRVMLATEGTRQDDRVLFNKRIYEVEQERKVISIYNEVK